MPLGRKTVMGRDTAHHERFFCSILFAKQKNANQSAHAIFNIPAITKGVIITAKILPAPSMARMGKPFNPVACKSTAPVAKISTGSCMGRAMSGTSTAPFFRVNVSELAMADSMRSMGEPTTIETASMSVSPMGKPNRGIARNDNTATKPALNSQCTANRTAIHVASGAFETTSSASVPLSKSGRNSSSMPITSDNSTAIHTAELAKRNSVAGSAPIAKGNSVMISKNSTKG